MLVLGIDPGIARTGWAIIKKQTEPKLIAYGCIETKKSTPQLNRFKQLHDQLVEIIVKYKPKVICLEQLFFNRNVTTALTVGEARGIIKLCAINHQLELAEFTPLQIKTCVTGYGRASKSQVQQMVKSLLNLKTIPRPDDAADAVATALSYCFHNRSLI